MASCSRTSADDLLCRTGSNNYSTVPSEGLRLEFGRALARLRGSLTARPGEEQRPPRLFVVSGPRQAGKSTLLAELARDRRTRSLYAAIDGAEAATPGFWDKLWGRAEALARQHGSAVLLLDEVQQLGRWRERLGAEWERVQRHGVGLSVVCTTSCSLRTDVREIGNDAECIELAQWSAPSLAAAFGVSLEEAVDSVVSTGAYPGSVGMRHDYARWCAYIRESVIEPALSEIIALHLPRRPALLRQIFALCAASPAEIVSLQKLQAQLHEGAAIETIAAYLRLLEEAYLIVALDKMPVRVERRRSPPPKLIVPSNALLAATDPRGIPRRRDDPLRHRAWLTNACLAHAWNSGQRVSYWREEPHEVDAVIEGSWGKWAVCVRPERYDESSLRGLGEFSRRFPRYIPKVLCDEGEEAAAERVGVDPLPWRTLLGKYAT